MERKWKRAAAPPWPSDAFWTHVVGHSSGTPQAYLDNYTPTQEYYRSRTSKNAALLALLTDDMDAAQRALDTLLTLNPNASEVGFDHPEYNVSTVFGPDAIIQYGPALLHDTASGHQ